MANFDKSESIFQRLDWQILQNGWTSLYFKKSILNTDLQWFESHNFQIIHFDCRTWQNNKQMHQDLKVKFGFPDYYGENLDALNDSFSEVGINENGLIIALYHFDSVEKMLAHTLLEIFARNSRINMLFGLKLITLVQVDDPKFYLDPVGAAPILWNSKEWIDSARIDKS